MSGVMRLGRLHLTKDDTDYSGLSFGLTSVTLDGSVAAAGLDLSALCTHSCYLRPLTSGNDEAMVVRWEGEGKEGDEGRPLAASILQVRSTPLLEGGGGAKLPIGATALMPQVQLALGVLGGGGGALPYEAAWLELAPLLQKGGSGFTLAHPPPDSTAAKGLRRVAVGFALGPEEVKEEEGDAAAAEEEEGARQRRRRRRHPTRPTSPPLSYTAIEAGGGGGGGGGKGVEGVPLHYN